MGLGLESKEMNNNATYPLLLPLTLCSLNVTSLSSSSHCASLTHPRMSSSVVHQNRSETSSAVMASGSEGRSSCSLRLTPFWGVGVCCGCWGVTCCPFAPSSGFFSSSPLWSNPSRVKSDSSCLIPDWSFSSFLMPPCSLVLYSPPSP